MSSVFLLAFVPLVLWAVANFIDKILLSKYFQDGSVSVLMTYSGLIGVIAAPVFFLFDTTALSIPVYAMLALFSAGLLNALATWCYLRALLDEDTSTVIPFFQLIPVFGLVTGFFLLGEVLTGAQLFWGALIIIGGLLLSLDLSSAQFRIKGKLLILVLLSSALFALYEAIFKLLALDEGFWIAAFWQSVGLAAVGLVMLLVPSRRTAFMRHVRKSGTSIFGLNVVNEIIVAVGNAAYAFLLLLAPIALVMLTHIYQGLVVFVLALFLSAFFPGLIEENRRPRILIQKLASIGLITMASYFLFLA